MNDKQAPAKADAQRIRPRDPDDLRAWAARLGISAAELARIVAEVGTDPDKVRAYLNTRA